MTKDAPDLKEPGQDQLHLAAPGGPHGLVQEAERYIEGFLCKAWGETYLPEARLVRTREEWGAFVVEAQWGPDTSYSALDADDREMVDAQVRYIAQDMADNGEGSINFEIGGVSVERVTFQPASAEIATRNAALEEAAKVCGLLVSTDADWDTSYWNQAVERCAFAIRAMKDGPPTVSAKPPASSGPDEQNPKDAP